MRPKRVLMALLVVLLCACGGGAGPMASGAPTVAAPQTEIEPSAVTQEASDRAQRIGTGDALAQRCFDKPEGSADAPCSLQPPAACALRCREGDPGACKTLGEHFGAQSDTTCAMKVLALACEHEQLSGCTALAALLVEGHELERAAELLRRACEGGHGPGCTHLGKLLEGDETLDDRAEIATLLERGCELGDAEGCVGAARRYSYGDGVAEDHPRAAELARKACELGDDRGCIELATAILLGRGVTQDQPRALQLLEAVCRSDESGTDGDACLLLVQYAGNSSATSGSLQTGKLYARACNKGNVNACTEVVTSLYSKGRYQEAIEISTKHMAKHPGMWRFDLARGMSLFDMGRFAGSIPNLERLCKHRPDWGYCQLWLYAARIRMGAKGNRQLQEAADTIAKDVWPRPIFMFFLGKLSSRKLLQIARNPLPQTQLEQECEAFYYIGQQHMIAGRRQQARDMFHKTIDTGIVSFVEYTSAKAELARLARP